MKSIIIIVIGVLLTSCGITGVSSQDSVGNLPREVNGQDSVAEMQDEASAGISEVGAPEQRCTGTWQKVQVRKGKQITGIDITADQIRLTIATGKVHERSEPGQKETKLKDDPMRNNVTFILENRSIRSHKFDPPVFKVRDHHGLAAFFAEFIGKIRSRSSHTHYHFKPEFEIRKAAMAKLKAALPTLKQDFTVKGSGDCITANNVIYDVNELIFDLDG